MCTPEFYQRALARNPAAPGEVTSTKGILGTQGGQRYQLQQRLQGFRGIPILQAGEDVRQRLQASTGSILTRPEAGARRRTQQLQGQASFRTLLGG